MSVRFGTDGWRAIIGDEFTRENVVRVARAYGAYLHQRGAAHNGVVVGYDARFLSDRMARHMADALAEGGVPVALASTDVPTPAVSHAVVERQAAGGISVTASHNPPEYNGVKFKAAYGGSAPDDAMRAIESYLDGPWPTAQAAPLRVVGLHESYAGYLRDAVPAPRAGRRLRLVVDPMHGAARGLTAALLREQGHDVVEIRGTRNPAFGGVFPEPVPPHTNMLAAAVRAQGADLGLATDGDGDRIGVVTGSGEFFDAHRVLALLAYHLLAVEGRAGRIVKTVSTTSMLDRIARVYGAQVTVTRIGFKYVCEEILRGGVLLAGEESGGVWTEGSIPDRDGVRTSLLLAGLVSRSGKPLDDMWRDLTARFGTFAYRRRDCVLPAAARDAVEGAATACDKVGGIDVREVDTRDGVKLVREDGHWVMFRFSGTEPLLRLYTEASTSEECTQFLDEAEEIVQAASRESGQ
jgi:phosphomannomutase